MNLKSWLRRVPQPSVLRCDGKKTIQIGQGKNKWRDAIQAIEALQPALVEALNADGDTIRVAHLNEGDEDVSEKPLPSEAKTPEAQLAALILEASDRGAARHADAYTLAFSKMTELCSLLAHRLTNIEGALQRQFESRERALEAAGSGEGDGADKAVQAMLMQGLMKGALSDSPPPNGKGK